MSREPRPIVIRRPVVAAGHGHHGGAWKVAYADFVTAMMAFFLLLWLISSASEETKKGLADFFSNATVNIGPPGGVGGILDGLTVTPAPIPPLPASPFDRPPELPVRLAEEEPLEAGFPAGSAAAEAAAGEAAGEAAADAAERQVGEFAKAKAAILAALQVEPGLRGFKDSLLVEEAPEGLRVQLLDREQLPMFPLGSDAMLPHTRWLLGVVAAALTGTSGRLSLRGHTDSLAFAPNSGRDNWRLSADRANATRLALVEAGLDPARVAEVVGRADAEPLLPDRPEDPRNRRISIVLLRVGGPAADGPASAAPGPVDAPAGAR